MSKQTDREKTRRCPVCGKAESAALAPFCSKRCANVDLHRWLSGGYAIPAEDQAAKEEGEDRQ